MTLTRAHILPAFVAFTALTPLFLLGAFDALMPFAVPITVTNYVAMLVIVLFVFVFRVNLTVVAHPSRHVGGPVSRKVVVRAEKPAQSVQ